MNTLLERVNKAKAMTHKELGRLIASQLLFKTTETDYRDLSGEWKQLDWITHDRDSVHRMENELLYGEHFDDKDLDEVRRLYETMLQMCAGYDKWIVMAEARPRAEAIWCVLDIIGVKLNKNKTNATDIVLFCPNCSKQHIDEPNPDICQTCGHHHKDHMNAGERNICGGGKWNGDVHSDNGCKCEDFEPWLNPPHKSHRCQFCNHVWRPFEYETNGVKL